MRVHRWGSEKADRIDADVSRRVGFGDCIVAIEEKRILDILENANYPGQKIYVLEIDGYAYVVPFVETEDEIFLKTVFPSRKYTRKYLG